MNTINTISPQALGGLIKRTGVLKSESRRGNSYNYHTEGYVLTRQYGDEYTLSYYSRMQLARPTESQQEAFNQRQSEAFKLITEALDSKGIAYSYGDYYLRIKGVK